LRVVSTGRVAVEWRGREAIQNTGTRFCPIIQNNQQQKTRIMFTLLDSFGSLSLTDIAFSLLFLTNVYLLVTTVLASRNKSHSITSTTNNIDTSTKIDRVLLVIAHPDDESMFFVPTILTLTDQPDSSLYVLCLSTGNFDGLGLTRTKELYASARVLGIEKERVIVVDDPVLQDGKNQSWSKKEVARQVSAHVKQWKINKILTFDDYGVSGHENHIDTSHGVRHFHQTSEWGQKKSNTLYQLESTGICRKYTGVFDMTRSLVQSDTQCFCSLAPWVNYGAMRAHFSQFVWYRRMFVLFSRYTYVNTIKSVSRDKERGQEVDESVGAVGGSTKEE